MASAGISGPSILRIMSGIERAIQDGRRETLQKAALAGKAIHAAEIAKASGGDSKLSGAKRVGSARRGIGAEGAKVGVRYDESGTSFDPEALLKATGPLQLIEGYTNPHMIRSSHLTGTKARRSVLIGPSMKFDKRKVVGPTLRPIILIPGVGYRAWARHPGTRGKRPWEIGKERARPVETRIMRSSTFQIIKKAAKP